MPRLLAVLAVLALAACNRGPKVSTPTPGQRPLATYAVQRIAVTPVGIARSDTLGWLEQLGGARAVARRLDTLFLRAAADRGLASRWVMPPDLARSYERNRNYAADPYALALDQVRAKTFVALSRFGEPLSTQLRTMIALHEDTRFVLLPVELRFERDAGDAGHGILRVALLDPRFAEAKWVGDVRGDTSSIPGRALASVATRLADLFTAP